MSLHPDFFSSWAAASGNSRKKFCHHAKKSIMRVMRGEANPAVPLDRCMQRVANSKEAVWTLIEEVCVPGSTRYPRGLWLQFRAEHGGLIYIEPVFPQLDEVVFIESERGIGYYSTFHQIIEDPEPFLRFVRDSSYL